MSVSTPPMIDSDVFLPLDQYPDLNVSFTQWEISEIRKSWASMRDEEIEVSQEKANVGTASAFFCQQFYENLLGEYPELSVLFPSIKSQASSMAGILALVISQLDNLARVREVIVSLGKRHSRIIGVEVAHYELVGNALLRTLSDRLQEGFSPEVENAWIKFFAYITNMMLQAGEDPPLPAQTLYPVLTPVSSQSSSLTPNQRRALKSKTSEEKTFPVQQTPAATAAAATTVTPIQPTMASAYNGGSNYQPQNSHFKTVTPAAVKKKRRGGKGQECLIM